MQKITPFLWFADNADKAMEFYVQVFNNAPNKSGESKVVSIERFPDQALDEHTVGLEGKVANGIFWLNGQQFMAFDGGPLFKFNEAISLFVECESQEEVDYFWEKLSAVPEAEACGWLKDKHGVSWQIVPKIMSDLLGHKDKEKAIRATKAMLKMKKIDVAALQAAFDGESKT